MHQICFIKDGQPNLPEEVAAPEVPQVEVAQDATPNGGGVDGQHLQHDKHERLSQPQRTPQG
jgi:hypothetical protein